MFFVVVATTVNINHNVLGAIDLKNAFTLNEQALISIKKVKRNCASCTNEMCSRIV